MLLRHNLGSLILLCASISASDLEDANWKEPFNGMGAGPVHDLLLVGEELFLAGPTTAGGQQAPGIARWDGAEWHIDPVDAVGLGYSLSHSQQGVFAAGDFQNSSEEVILLRWNGAGWISFGPSLDGTIYQVAASGTNIFIGGDFRHSGATELNHIAKWDGSTWAPLNVNGTNGVDNTVQTLFLDENGELYVSGWFTTAGGEPVSNVLKWDGESWTSLGESLVYANEYGSSRWHANSITKWRGDIYVTGRFTKAGETPVSRVARYDGSEWHSLGSGFGLSSDSTIEGFELAPSDDGLYVGGNFYEAGGLLSRFMAKWNGIDWESVVPELSGPISSITLAPEGMYFAGRFSRIGDETFSGIARRFQGELSALGSDVHGPIFVMKKAGESVYIGGDFLRAGSYDAFRIAELRGGKFRPMGQGMDAAVRAVAISSDQGTVFAGGDFTTAGGEPIKALAQWDGTNWSTVAEPLTGNNPRVSALLWHENKLYVGGAFTLSGGVKATNLAVWDGSQWRSIGNPNGTVTSLGWHQERLYIGGFFNQIGTNGNLRYLAAYDPTLNDWSAVGGSVDKLSNSDTVEIKVLESHGSDLYVGGKFQLAGGKRINSIARWDGHEFHPLGTGITNGVNGIVAALHGRGKELYVVGSLSKRFNETDHYHILHFDGSQWSHLGDRQRGALTGLAAMGNDLLVGGTFWPPPLKVWQMPTVTLMGTSEPVPALGTISLQMGVVNFFQVPETLSFYEKSNLVATVSLTAGVAGAGMADFIWENVPAGQYELRAVGSNSNGDRIESSPVSINVAQPENNLAPSATLELIAEQSSYLSTDPIGLKATGADEDGSISTIEIRDQWGTILGRSSELPFVAELFLSPGTYDLVARAIDNSGGTTISSPLRLNVSPPNQPPSIFISEPFPGEFVPTGMVLLKAEAGDLDGNLKEIEFRAGANLLAEGSGPSLSFYWTNPPAGQHTITATATDDTGGTTSRQVTFKMKTDQQMAEAQEPMPNLQPFTAGWVTDGEVLALLQTNDTVFVGGKFTHIGQQIPGSSVVELSAEFPDLSYPAVDGLVNIIVPDGAGGYYLGGLFEKVGDIPLRNAAHIRADKSVNSSWRPNPNSHVIDIAIGEDRVFLGGEFTEIAGVPQRYLAAVSKETGALLPWNPEPDGWVSALAIYDQRLYVGGNFRRISGSERRHLAAVHTETGAMDAWVGWADDPVTQLKIHDGRLYVAGFFSALNGSGRSGLGALDLVTGSLLNWNPNPQGQVRDFAFAGNTVFLGGSFGRIGGVDRSNLAAVDGTTGVTLPWRPDPDGELWSLAVLEDTLYISGNFQFVGTVARNRNAAINTVTGEVQDLDLNSTGALWSMTVVENRLLGAGALGLVRLPRQGLAAFDAPTGIARAWNPQCNGEVHALAFAENILYVGGGFHSLGGQERTYLGAVDAMTGEATDWNPSPNSGVRALALTEKSVLVGGWFSEIEGKRRSYVAEVGRETGLATGWYPILDDGVTEIEVDDENVYLGGRFDSVHGAPRNGLARVSLASGFVDDWNPAPSPQGVDEILLAGEVLYVRGGFTQIGGEMRELVAQLDKETGRATAWALNANAPISSIALLNSTLFIGGQFTSFSGLARTNVAAVDTRLRSENVLPWNPSIGDRFGTSAVGAMSVTPDAIFVGGHFQEINGEKRPFVAGFPFTAQLDLYSSGLSSLFQVRLIGPLGRTYIFEASTNLVEWTPVLTNRAPFLFEDLQAVNYPHRFYRARPSE